MKNSIDKLKSAIEKINRTSARSLTPPPPGMIFVTQPANKKGACCYIHDTLGKQCIGGVTKEVCERSKFNGGLYEGDFREGQTCDIVSGGKCPREATGTNASTDMVSARKQAAPYLLADPAKDIYDGRNEVGDPTVTCDACVDGNSSPPCNCLRAFYGGYFWIIGPPGVPGYVNRDPNYVIPPGYRRGAEWPANCPPIAEMIAPAFTAASWPGLKTSYITRLADRIIAGGVGGGELQACHTEWPRVGTSPGGILCALVRQCKLDRLAGNPCTGPLYDSMTEVPNVPSIVKYMMDNGCVGGSLGSTCRPDGLGGANICTPDQPQAPDVGWSILSCAQRDFGNCDTGLAPQFITNENELKMPANEEQKKAAGELIKQLKLFTRR